MIDPGRLPPNKAALGAFVFALIGFLLSLIPVGYLIYLGLRAYFTGGN